MWDIFRFIAGLVVIVAFVVFYQWIKSYAEFNEAKEKEIRKDIAEFGACCGMESGACTYKPKLDKLNKLDIDQSAAKKDK